MIVIIGAGLIAEEYVKIFLKLKKEVCVVSRGEEKALRLKEKYPEAEVMWGGHASHKDKISKAEACIIAVNVNQLSGVCIDVLECGVKKILAEKPLATNNEEMGQIEKAINKNGGDVYIAYNRRNYASVKAARRICEEDGGILSLHFDFTEAIFRIPDGYDRKILNIWGLANSTHVIDTAFHFMGRPDVLEADHFGENRIDWHKQASIFTGKGVSESGIPFTYHANWVASGKWNIEIMTANRKLLFSPMEVLREQKYGTFKVVEADVDYSDDKEFKPGFKAQCEALLSHPEELLNFWELKKNFPYFLEILGYN